jgi:hypothetical protein
MILGTIRHWNKLGKVESADELIRRPVDLSKLIRMHIYSGIYAVKQFAMLTSRRSVAVARFSCKGMTLFCLSFHLSCVIDIYICVDADEFALESK